MEFLRRIIETFGRRRAPMQDRWANGALPGTRGMPGTEDLPTNTAAQRSVRQICEEAIAAMQGWQAKLSLSARWNELKNEDPALQIAVMMAAVSRRPPGAMSYTGSAWQVEALRHTIVSQLVRRNLPLTSAQLRELLQAWFEQRYGLEYGLPGRAMLGAVERHAQHAPLDDDLRIVLEKLRGRVLEGNLGNRMPNKFLQQVADRIERLLDPGTEAEKDLPPGPFAASVSEWLTNLPAEHRKKWRSLAMVAAFAGDKSKPSSKWLGQANDTAGKIVPEELVTCISRWMEDTTPDPSRPDASLDILKGLLWLTPQLKNEEIAGQVGRFAEKCFRKVPQIGARSVKLGNAALWALSEMAGEPRAGAELFRLREKIKYPSARKLIENRLDELASKGGQTVADMEDVSLPPFGLDDHAILHFDFGNSRAELEVQADVTTQRWFGSGGKALKSIPAEVRNGHAGELARFKQAAKDIEAARAAQVLRLEQSWIEDRSWSLATWQEHFLGHPLRRPIVEALVWCVGNQIVIPEGEALTDVGGCKHKPGQDDRVRLWHPLDSQPEEVLAWRRRFLDLGITQPIKQAHREIYVLTDAERQTRTYSNRFAAHILRQHQFRALCQARGWHYDLMGGWDGWNIPTRRLPGQGLLIEYHVDVVDDGQHSDSYVSLHLASDQVRFLDGERQAVELEGIAPIVFSEVLRDVDLFVAVTSVANDPNWTDGGPEGRYGGYWREWAFGDLGQSAATRKELISCIASRLSIADKLEITDKFLVVQGKRQQYAIHFGSSNIQILPSNRYLCIVPDRPPQEVTGLKLPFTGDGLLSTILAKAFLLVDEDKIRDQTILRQL